MYDQFRWTNASARRNGVTLEYEPLQPFFLLALAESAGCRTFVDIGANIGVYGLFATLVPAMERVVACEANYDTAQELRKNVALNSLEDRIEVVEKAVSSSVGELSFGVVSKFSGANSVVDTTLHDQDGFHKKVTVEAVTLDLLFPQRLSSPVCIKIDVEGHEAQVVEGAADMLRANKAVLQLEGYDQADHGSTRKLEDLGYHRLTGIGPDHYFSNIEALCEPAAVVRVYEQALSRMIAYNHRNKSVALKRGDLSVQLTGKSASIARSVARRLVGRHL